MLALMFIYPDAFIEWVMFHHSEVLQHCPTRPCYFWYILPVASESTSSHRSLYTLWRHLYHSLSSTFASYFFYFAFSFILTFSTTRRSTWSFTSPNKDKKRFWNFNVVLNWYYNSEQLFVFYDSPHPGNKPEMNPWNILITTVGFFYFVGG